MDGIFGEIVLNWAALMIGIDLELAWISIFLLRFWHRKFDDGCIYEPWIGDERYDNGNTMFYSLFTVLRFSRM
jgi:hypothetical protein